MPKEQTVEENVNDEEQTSSGKDNNSENWAEIDEYGDYRSYWEKNSFDYQQTKQWIERGLYIEEYDLATYAKSKSYNPNSVDLEELKTELRQAQNWLDYHYPLEKRSEVKKLVVERRNLIGSLKLTSFTNLEELSCLNNKLTNLELSDCTNLRELQCQQNQLISLNVSHLANLETIYCQDNKLTSLNLSGCTNLKNIYCYVNYLNSLDFLSGLGSEKLERISIAGNNLTTGDLNLNPFGKFVNLQELDLGNTQHLSGSLESLKYLTKLEQLDISNTNINSGLEYLSESIHYFNCSTKHRPESEVKIIEQELAHYKDKTEEGKYDFQKWRDENIVKMVPTLPPSLSSEKGNKLTDNYDIKEKYYEDKIHIKNSLFQGPAELPFRIYNIKENKIEKTYKDQKGHYAILSYVWGKSRKDCEVPEEAEKELNDILKNSSVEYENKVTLLGYKSWKKAVKTCKLLDVNYLWMDQLCINQAEKTTEEQKEMEQEVSKMRQYYSNAAVTLIAIQTEAKVDEEELDLLDILKRITCSEWFTRSWTFQEGWLSKWTLFMFDDILVDGREMASLWVFQQPSHIGIRFSKNEQGTKKVATPIGWVYYKGKDGKGYKSTDAVSLRLHEALREIKTRGRYLPIDGVYSILGLLPYGDKVKINYKKDEDGMCTREYTEKELQEALLSVMKSAIEYGHGEPLAWHGIGSGWLPQINEQGSTTIEGGIKIDYLPHPQKQEEIFQIDGSIRITGSEYVIKKVDDIMSRWDQSSSIESGARERKIWIGDNEDIELSGTKPILSLMNKLVKEKEKKNDIRLLVPNKYQWRSTKPFAILIEVRENNHYGLGLVEISEGSKKLQGSEEKIIVKKKPNIWPNEKKVKEISLQDELKTKWQNLQEQINKLSVQVQEELLTQIQVEVSKKFT